MAKDSRTLKLEILAETKKLSDGLKDANTKVNNASSGMSESFKKVGLALAAAGAAAGAYAIKIGIEGVKAAIEDTAAQERLAASLRNTTNATDAQIASVESQINKLAMATGVADDELRPAFSRLSIATNDLTTSQDLLTLALDISAATGKSVESVTNALGKAYEGSTTALTRLGVGLSAADIQTLGLEGSISKLATTFGGAAATQAETFEGKMQILRVRLDEAKESIGTALLPILDDLTTFVNNNVVPAVEGFARFWERTFIPYIRTTIIPELGNLRTALSNVGDALGSTRTKTREASTEMGYFETVVRTFIPSIIYWFTTAANVWATLIDVLRRGVAFLQGDFDTALAKFENRFDSSAKSVNNVNTQMANAYKQFQFFTNLNRSETIPSLDDFNDKADDAAGGANNLAASVGGAAVAFKNLSAAQREFAALRAGGAIPGALSPELRQFYKSELSLISGFGGLIEGINLNPNDPFFGFGKGESVGAAIRGYESGSVRGGATVNINVNGTVVDPEGTARAVQQVIQNSNARAGELTFIPAIGFE